MGYGKKIVFYEFFCQATRSGSLLFERSQLQGVSYLMERSDKKYHETRIVRHTLHL